jgi:hypothetical protein
MLFKIEGKKENHVKEKRKALNKEDKWNIGSSHIKLRAKELGWIKVSSNNFQGWGKKRRLKKKYDNFLGWEKEKETENKNNL